MPHHSLRSLLYSCVAATFALALPVSDAYAQDDALSLESAPAEKAELSNSTKLFIEGAVGNASQRYLPDSVDTRRASVDLMYSDRIGPGLRAVFSDRIDAIHPSAIGVDGLVNSLREAYLSWQPDGGDTVVDFGCINLRNGPAYGYNPTDFFRDGSLRVITSADPFALRQNRIGSVMVRAQRLWNGGSFSAAYSPKLADRPSAEGWNLDLGSTNNRDRALFTLGTQISQNVNSQILLYSEDAVTPTLGANMTALLSDAAVAHLEWTHGSEIDLLSRVLGTPTNRVTRDRFVAGVTYTTLSKTSITAEYQYNGFGLDQSGWAGLGGVPTTQLAYLSEALRLQELAPRSAYLIYVTQKALWLTDLDLTAYLRVNAVDNSKLAWVELRHHWPKFDLTFQYEQNIGSADSEFGVLPDRRVMQVIGAYYF
jgi:hypothetical protein